MATLTPVAAVIRKMKCVVLNDGRTAPFTEMYDAEGNETDDAELAVTAVAEHPDGDAWLSLDLIYFDKVTIH
jgi:hypothetical protein